MTNEQAIAKFIGELVATSVVRCDDQSLRNVAAAKQWLKAIEAGALVVAPKPAPVEEAA
jgi:hypothetical protein